MAKGKSMNHSPRIWSRLVQGARQAPPRSVPEIPLGFEARVVARWRASEPRLTLVRVWELLSRRALVCGCALMLISLGTAYGLMHNSWMEVLRLPDAALEIVIEE
jgi:hypothetical protein